MATLLILAVSSLFAALLLTPLCRRVAIGRGLVDEPDHIRKFHARSIPRTGGVAVFVAYLASFVVLRVSLPSLAYVLGSDFGVVRILFPAATVVFFIGFLDDLAALTAWQKFAGQVAASVVAVSAGIQITGIASHHLPPWCAIPVTLLWLVACTNAFNLIDGVDGLAAGVGLFATTTILIAALLERNTGLAIATVPLAGALLGFIRFNFNPASIFLGDSGSLFIGFLLGCYSVLWNQKSATILGMTAPLMVLSIPLLDTGLAILRRFLRRQPIFGADHGHIHHKLLARGLTPRRVVVLVYVICGVCAALSLIQRFAHEGFGGGIVILFCAGTWMGIRHLGYPEFEMARRIVLNGNFRRLLNSELQLSTFGSDLAAAATPDRCWEVLQRNYGEFGFNEIRLKVGTRLYTDTKGHRAANTWTVRIKLSETDYLNLSRKFDTQPPPIVARFTDVIGKILCANGADRLRSSPIQPGVRVRQARLSNEIEEAIQPITAMIRNSDGTISAQTPPTVITSQTHERFGSGYRKVTT